MISKISDNAYYVYMNTSSYTENNSLSRIRNIFSYKHSVLRNYKTIIKKFGIPDVVMGCSVHPLAWIAACKIAKKYKARFIVEVRDLWPEMWLLNGEKKKHDPMVVFFSVLEKWAYRKADKIIYSMQYGDKYICEKLGFSKDKVLLIGQPLDCQRYYNNAVTKGGLIPDNIKAFIENSFICVFTGYYMKYEGVYVILEAAKILQDKKIPVKILFVGSGSEKMVC